MIHFSQVVVPNEIIVEYFLAVYMFCVAEVPPETSDEVCNDASYKYESNCFVKV